MSLILSTGTNLGDRVSNLEIARNKLSENFEFIAKSQIVESAAVDYLDQPKFLNQLLEFKVPKLSPEKTIELILKIEKELGRIRNIDKGPRIIDIDIIFWNLQNIDLPNLKVPHPSWQNRSFIAQPLKEIPFYKEISKNFQIPTDFNNTCYPYRD